MAAPFLRWQLPDSQIRLRLLHLNVYQLNLLQRKDLHILSFSRMENYPTRFVSTRFVSIRGHQFFCYPSYQKWQSDNPLQMDCAKKTASCFIGAYLPNVCWTVTNWAQASVSLNRRPSQRSQINSLHDISGRTLRSTVRIIPPNGEKKKNGRKSMIRSHKNKESPPHLDIQISCLASESPRAPGRGKKLCLEAAVRILAEKQLAQKRLAKVQYSCFA